MLKRLVCALCAVLCMAMGLSVPTALGAASDALDLPALHGKVVYVDFWASWCVPCRESFPWMNSIQHEFSTQGFVVIAVNVDHERSDAEDFLRRFSPDFRITYDPLGTLAEQFHVKGMPTSVLIDRSGKVVNQHTGFRQADRGALRDQIRSLLVVP
jgi:cytochrome c biogenesis protein CcmG, thiol:disulfide interchange protein DsbE